MLLLLKRCIEGFVSSRNSLTIEQLAGESLGAVLATVSVANKSNLCSHN